MTLNTIKPDKLIIIKLGGAAITDKSTPFTLRPEVLENVIKELSEIELPLIVIHGAGSFAHTLAKDYDLANGVSDTVSLSSQIEGITKIRVSMQKLHLTLISKMQELGMHPYSLPVSANLISSGPDKIQQNFFDPFIHALNLGFIPISYGDMSFDTESKYRVISGDRIIQILTNFYRSQDNDNRCHLHVIFGSNVDGIYDRDPQETDAKVIETIKREDIDKMIANSGDSAGIDVTGGMKGKLLEIKKMLPEIDVLDVVNITVPGRLTDLLAGNKVMHTHIQ